MTEDILTVNELFSGIGAQRKALERLGIDHEVVGVCEIDKYAIQSYEAIFGKTKNYGDICTAPRLDYADLWTYSFPCQDISVAGRGKGINENTRSGLLYQVQRLLEVAKDEGTLPKYLLLENVKNLVGKKFKSQFDDWLFYLDQLGYDTYWQVLNAKNYGIPQNRERVFAISIRKDLNQSFEFPKPEELTKRLKDILEDEVNEKYYISQDKVEKFIKNLENTNLLMVREATKKGYAEATVGDSINIEQPNSKTRRGRVGHGVAQTLTTAPQQVVVQSAILSKYGTNLDRTTDLSTTLMAIDYKGFGNQAQIGIIEFPCIAASRGRYIENTDAGEPTEQRLEINTQGTTNTITTVQKDNYVIEKKILEGTRIRKLTPLECWLLMGFDDEDFRKAEASGVSNSQLYKQAGNSIVVNVLEKIFKNLCK